MAQLFISHASEDKEGFVRPLAEELRKAHSVWYDEYSLKLGDSLRASIDAGLKASDFGVVILSPAFFAKRWTNLELSALFSLESTNRKMILPVWLNVSAADVKNYSPLLADRFAVDASRGLSSVVDAITGAVEGAKQTQLVLEPDHATKALSAAVGLVRSNDLDQRILRSEAGAKLALDAANEAWNGVWHYLEAQNGEHQLFVRPTADAAVIHGPYRSTLQAVWKDLYSNSAVGAVFSVAVETQQQGFRFEAGSKLKWRVTCVGEQRVAFTPVHSKEIITTHQVAHAIVTAYAGVIQTLALRGRD